jgi:hypothetical protein
MSGDCCLPRFWLCTLELCNSLHQCFFWIAKLDHSAQVGLTTEKERMHEFSGGREGAFLIYQSCYGSRYRRKGVGMHHCRSCRCTRLYKVLVNLMNVIHNFGDVPVYAIVIEVLHPSLVQHSHKSTDPHGH